MSANIQIPLQATVELARVTLDLTVETPRSAIDIARSIVTTPFRVPGALLGDIIYGPLDEIVFDGLKNAENT